MYNFSRNLKLYVVKSGSRYKIDTYSGLDFSYVYSETSIERKTIHQPERLHKGAVVNYVMPGSVSFTTPLRYGNDLDFWIEGAQSQNLVFYLIGDGIKIKVNKAVVESIQYNFAREGVFTISASVTFASSELVTSIAEPVVDDSGNFGYIERLQVLLDGDEITNITGINLQLTSGVTWVPYESIHDVSIGNKVFRRDYVIESKTYSGQILHNLTDENYSPDIIEEAIVNSLYFKVSGFYGTLFELTLGPVIYTSRLDFSGDLVSKAYDFRMIGEE